MNHEIVTTSGSVRVKGTVELNDVLCYVGEDDTIWVETPDRQGVHVGYEADEHGPECSVTVRGNIETDVVEENDGSEYFGDEPDADDGLVPADDPEPPTGPPAPVDVTEPDDPAFVPGEEELVLS